MCIESRRPALIRVLKIFLITSSISLENVHIAVFHKSLKILVPDRLELCSNIGILTVQPQVACDLIEADF